jgi:hypothetical protein
MACGFGISRYPGYPSGEADILGNQKAKEHGEESGDIPSIERKLLPENSSNCMIQYRHVLNGRYLRFSFVCRQLTY